MLKVTIELHPYGDASQAETLRTVYIGNMGVTRHDYVTLDKKCKYHAWLDYNPAGIKEADRKAPDAVVEHWRSRGAEVLVAAVLEKLDGPFPTK